MATLPLFLDGGTHTQFFDFVLNSLNIAGFFDHYLDPVLAKISRPITEEFELLTGLTFCHFTTSTESETSCWFFVWIFRPLFQINVVAVAMSWMVWWATVVLLLK